ncbi:hypothetical protein A5886_000552 [Enterococcus sp. 8G7_MSG3316]|uniref:ABC transporter domain-containing protein n=1 Tax=Candidatus Enterococcus testudinis TaxID=1834191 RepID=A0A242A3F5_9ENTE|nr:ABC transporter ATP-binding protein [Enterococcus sp. 8G7_MSG3316]OTN75482.1 hypothetical protein A5886_000552 [Enterococcus sp. 8G7_MSG3316]
MDKIIEANHMTVCFNLKKGKELRPLKAIEDVSIAIERGEILGIIGESGSGKSTLAFAILNLIDTPGEIIDGEVCYIDGEKKQVDLLTLSLKDEMAYRWQEVATVFQAAQSALNPIITVEEHFIETYAAHVKEWQKDQLLAHITELIEYVRLDKSVLKMYPFELSGGMKQRVLIALSLLLDPKVIILDEPTTALDVITQWYILEILRKINREKGITIIFLTHDISIVSSMVDRIAVMYAGQIVEIGPVGEVAQYPGHPYTQALLEAIPNLEDSIETRQSIRGATFNMLEADGTCRFKSRCSLARKINCEGLSSQCNQLFSVSNNHFARCAHANEMRGVSHDE